MCFNNIIQSKKKNITQLYNTSKLYIVTYLNSFYLNNIIIQLTLTLLNITN